jgi:hypothetical protein
MLSYSSLVNSGKVTLPSVDSWGTNMNIIRDPPKSITTRRRDKVGENSDILKMIDNSDRSSEAILRFARGVNPSVSVSYSNNGGSLQNFGNQQAKLPYSINKDGDFHPPVQAPQNLLPLSRLPRNVTFAITNPTMPHFGKELPNSRNTKTTSSVKEEIISSQVRPTKRYYLQKPFQEAFESNYMIQPILQKSADSNISTTNRTNVNVLEPTKEINKDNLNAFVQSNNASNSVFKNDINNFNSTNFINDLSTYSVNTNLNDIKGVPIDFDLSNINTKDVTLIEYSAPLNANGQTNYIHENFELDRTLPYYESKTNINYNKNMSLINNDLELERNLPQHESRTNFNSNKLNSFIHDDLELERTLPYHESRTNFNSNKLNSFIHDDINLDRVLPNYNAMSNNKGNGERINYIHKDIELNRTLPEHQSNTNIKQNGQKTLKHEYIKELDRKSYVSNMETNNNKQGENNISSRKYNLEDKLQLGEYNIPGNIPTFDRMQMVKENYESDKSKMGKIVSQQFHGKYK